MSEPEAAVSVEVVIPRPGRTYPWVAVIQSDDGEFAWGLFSQGRTVTPFATGRAETVEAAESSARDAAATIHRRSRG